MIFASSWIKNPSSDFFFWNNFMGKRGHRDNSFVPQPSCYLPRFQEAFLPPNFTRLRLIRQNNRRINGVKRCVYELIKWWAEFVKEDRKSGSEKNTNKCVTRWAIKTNSWVNKQNLKVNLGPRRLFCGRPPRKLIRGIFWVEGVNISPAILQVCILLLNLN